MPYPALGTFTLTLIRQITKCGEDFNLDYTSLEFGNHLLFFAFCGSLVSRLSAYSQNENGPKSPNVGSLSLSPSVFFFAPLDVYMCYICYKVLSAAIKT